ncbi:hypothetical protein [Bradyrhizobium sp. NBAIM01]|uniref:hypothetical protein n=1 Tax=Bradyrhizobium sp. NBAIM01 TaxID=2793818 RepID=UPI001CD1A30C|nr:hypothetical protein [Bradyrhizobium sp. NBAIM01]MCA1512162.1 hypothetical protein [Bradyrhizobium sp. NBAIM01]
MQKSPRKRGRPPVGEETEQVAVRLPRAWIEMMRPHLSQNIRNRLHRSLFEEQIDQQRDQHLVRLGGQIEELARRVRRATRADWHADRISHQIFLETLRLLFESEPAPTAEISNVKSDPKQAAELIFNSYIEEVREHEQGKHTMRMKQTLLSKIEGSDG